MPDTHYINPKLVEIYDLDSGWSLDRDFYLSLAGPKPQTILDLGCGTGLLCNAYAANNHYVTGVDPSPAMLEAGRRKEHGNEIEWVQSAAQTFQSDKLFDLIIMTGHAFQVLLEDVDILETFATMRNHLNKGGIIAFESRNPSYKWEKEWNYDIVIELPTSTVRESRRFLSMENTRLRFELCYDFPDETLMSASELRFSSKAQICEYLTGSGLRVDKLLGDWDSTPFDERSSQEMIFIVGAAR